MLDIFFSQPKCYHQLPDMRTMIIQVSTSFVSPDIICNIFSSVCCLTIFWTTLLLCRKWFLSSSLKCILTFFSILIMRVWSGWWWWKRTWHYAGKRTFINIDIELLSARFVAPLIAAYINSFSWLHNTCEYFTKAISFDVVNPVPDFSSPQNLRCYMNFPGLLQKLWTIFKPSFDTHKLGPWSNVN